MPLAKRSRTAKKNLSSKTKKAAPKKSAPTRVSKKKKKHSIKKREKVSLARSLKAKKKPPASSNRSTPRKQEPLEADPIQNKEFTERNTRARPPSIPPLQKIVYQASQFIDRFLPRTSNSPIEEEETPSPEETIKDQLSTQQKETWRNCIEAIKDQEFKKIEKHLSNCSRKDRIELRNKLLTEFASYPYIIGYLTKCLKKEK